MINDPENQQPNPVADSDDTAPDSETQSSADSAQGHRNNPVLNKEITGQDTTDDKAEGN